MQQNTHVTFNLQTKDDLGFERHTVFTITERLSKLAPESEIVLTIIKEKNCKSIATLKGKVSTILTVWENFYEAVLIGSLDNSSYMFEASMKTSEKTKPSRVFQNHGFVPPSEEVLSEADADPRRTRDLNLYEEPFVPNKKF